MRRMLLLLLLASCVFADEASDLRNARAVFEENIRAIHQRDRAKYVSLYLNSPRLIRTSPTGFVTGYEDFAKGAGSTWPDTLEATDIRLTLVRPGVVYGTYRYRVRYGTDETSGISERLFVDTPDGWKIALTGAIGTTGVPPSPRAIVGGTLIDGRGGAPVRNANVIVRDGKIDCAGTAEQCPLPAGVDVVDAKGMWITPGLVDAHVHFSQTGWADGRPDALDVRAAHPYEQVVAKLKASPERIGRAYLCSGITAVFDVGGYPWTLQVADRFADDRGLPHVAAAGPLLSTLDHWLNTPAERQFIHLKDADSGRGGVRYLAAQGAKAIKVWYIEDNAAALAAAGEEAAKLKLPLIVHATELARAKVAMRAGAKLLVHSVDDAAIDDEFIALAKQHGTIVTPTLTVPGGYLRMYRAQLTRTAPVVDDPNGCVDAETRAKLASTATLDPGKMTLENLDKWDVRMAGEARTAAANLKRLAAAGIPIATGTDAGNPLTLHGPSIYAEMEAMQAAGMTPLQVIASSTIVAARAAGLDAITGTLEKGKSADLLLLRADPSADVKHFRQLRHVMRGGVLRSLADVVGLAQVPRDN